jgi:hypothetical protein
MLQAFHTQGKLLKTLTKDIEMVPNQQTTINLAELNRMIAEHRGVSVEDLALGITSREAKADYLAENPGVVEEEVRKQADPALAYGEDLLTDEKLAAQYRSQADVMYKEAKQLRDQADELDPPKKKVAAPKTTSKTTKAAPAKATPAKAKKTEPSDR